LITSGDIRATGVWFVLYCWWIFNDCIERELILFNFDKWNDDVAEWSGKNVDDDDRDEEFFALLWQELFDEVEEVEDDETAE
jgi:hypothetical protein